MEKEKRHLTEKQKANLAAGRAKLKAKRDSIAEVKPVETITPMPETPVMPSAPENNQAKTVKAELPKVTKVGGRIWWQVILGIVCLVVTVIFAMMYTKNMTNSFMAFGFVLSGGAAALFLFMGLRKREEGMQLNRPGYGKKKNFKANCLNIYYGFDADKQKYFCHRVAFEWMEPDQIKSGSPQQCLDDGKWYYVHIFDPVKKAYEPFKLPDTQYYSPKEFINPLVMPASRKVLKPKPGLGEKIRPMLLVIAIGVMGLIFVITQPAPDTSAPPTKTISK